MSYQLQNKGNIDITGNTEAELWAVPVTEGLSSVLIAKTTLDGKLKAGALSKVHKGDFTIPETLAPGLYTFQGRLTNINLTGKSDANADNYTLNSTPNVNISKGLGIVGRFGTTMTLTRVNFQTTPLPFGLSTYTEDGTFVDSLGNTGIYVFTTVPKSQKANLAITLVPHDGQTINDADQTNFLVSFKTRPATLHGKTIQFKVSGQSGDATYTGLLASYGSKLVKGVIDIL